MVRPRARAKFDIIESRKAPREETIWQTQSRRLIGAIIMIGYMLLIAAKLRRRFGSCVIGLALMLWAFWGDDWKPLLKREKK